MLLLVAPDRLEVTLRVGLELAAADAGAVVRLEDDLAAALAVELELAVREGLLHHVLLPGVLGGVDAGPVAVAPPGAGGERDLLLDGADAELGVADREVQGAVGGVLDPGAPLGGAGRDADAVLAGLDRRLAPAAAGAAVQRVLDLGHALPRAGVGVVVVPIVADRVGEGGGHGLAPAHVGDRAAVVAAGPGEVGALVDVVLGAVAVAVADDRGRRAVHRLGGTAHDEGRGEREQGGGEQGADVVRVHVHLLVVVGAACPKTRSGFAVSSTLPNN